MFHKIFLVVVGLVMFIYDGSSQQVSGVVKDNESGASIPFVNVLVKGTLQGVTADVEGNFFIDAPGGDTLIFSSVGYYPKEVRIRKNSVQRLTIYLKPNVEMLGEITVKPEIERALVLFRKIQEHKAENRQQLKNIGNYKTLSVTNVYVAIDTASNVSRLIDDFKTVTIESDDEKLRFSPVYLSESAKEVSGDSIRLLYSTKDGIFPRINQAIETYVLRNVVVDLDFYGEQINILDRAFLSPIGKNALSRYDLYLNDSSLVNGTKYYHFSFAPKNRYDQLFSGNFKIEDGSFALKEIEVNVPKEANLNFVKGFRGKVSYRKLPEKGWFFDEQDVRINLALRPESDSVSVYSSERVDDVAGGNWIVNQLTQYSVSERLDHVNADNWGQQPEFVGSGIKEEDYYRVEMLKQQKIVKGVDAVGGLALTGYVNAGKIDIGPAFDIYSSNAIEGHRFTLPLIVFILYFLA